MSILYSALLLIPFILCSKCGAEQVWSEGRYPYESSSTEIQFKKEIDNYSFTKKLKVDISASYPFFQSDSLFIEEVNRHLCSNAKDVFCSFIQRLTEEELKINEFDEEAISMDFDKRKISYFLTPTYASSRLVSVFSELHSYAGMPHGSTRYYAFNYCRDGQQMHELTLENLFLPDKDFANFIIPYCLRTLEKEQIGYCHPDPVGNIPVEIERKDLNVFTLSKNGLTITFQPYHVGGWADGPYSITIPFQKLMPYIRPEGPLHEFFDL